MRNKTSSTRKANILVLLFQLFLTSLLILPPNTVFSQDEDDDTDDEKKWELIVGVGVGYGTIYTGSDTYEISPIILLSGEYELGNFGFFLSTEEGLGASFTEENTGIFVVTGIDLGEERSPDDGDVLKDTPELKNPVSFFGGLGVDSDFGDFEIGAEYYKTKANYSSSISKDYTYNALLYSAEYSLMGMVTDNIFFQAGISLFLMNDAYAKAYHGVKYETEKLKKFKPKGGLHSTEVELESYYFFTEHIALGIGTGVSYLLGDAHDSPLTKAPLQSDTSLYAVYAF